MKVNKTQKDRQIPHTGPHRCPNEIKKFSELIMRIKNDLKQDKG